MKSLTSRLQGLQSITNKDVTTQYNQKTNPNHVPGWNAFTLPLHACSDHSLHQTLSQSHLARSSHLKPLLSFRSG